MSRSIYEAALGEEEFKRLHPKIQERFGFNSESGVAAVGVGVMDRLWHGAFYLWPFLALGTFRRILFPEQGSNISFKVENYAYKDSFGRETVTWIRSFETKKPRRFDAYMIHSPTRDAVIDYLGTHQHLAADIKFRVAENGGLALCSGDQRVYEGCLGFKFPKFLAGVANVCEWYDDSIEKYRISLRVTNRTWGLLFGYDGTFDVEWKPVSGLEIPDHVKPVREEHRE